MLSKRFYGAALMAAIVIPATLEGCSSSSPLCCTEFKPGATLDANIGGDAKAQVSVQAVGDFSAIASASIDDLTSACRGIAQDLDAPQADQDAAGAITDKQQAMTKWCGIAVDAIGSVKAKMGASASLKIVATPPVCQASISAKADCQAKCNGGVKCDFKANPPTCTGGKLQISCSGSCTAQAGASVSCEGSCDANCSGACTADPNIGVDCTGKCEGTCTAKAGVGTGTGAQADGTCNGTCKGTCAVTAPNVKCTGSCKGSCSGSCKAQAGASVKCDGKCDADYQPISCDGGKLEGGCSADVKCDGSCDASVSAKAECTPPEVTVTFTATADAEAAGKLVATLKAHLGVILAFKSRLEGMAQLTATITGSADAFGSIKAACIPQVIAAGAAAVSDVTASAQATVSVAGATVGGS
jgi:hypothetical protein